MKDGALLLLCGVTCALLAWAILHFLGSEALTTLLSVALLATVVDNTRLRRKLRKLEAMRSF